MARAKVGTAAPALSRASRNYLNTLNGRASIRARYWCRVKNKNIQNERSEVENSTILPNGQKLWRIDGSGTDDIFENGFNARGEDTDLQNYVNTNSPSIFVGTSKSPNILKNPDFGLPRKYFYQIDGSGLEGVDVNQVYPTNPFSDEEELAIIGTIPTESIIGAQQILPNGDLGSSIMNPNYGGNP